MCGKCSPGQVVLHVTERFVSGLNAISRWTHIRTAFADEVGSTDFDNRLAVGSERDIASSGLYGIKH